MATARIPAVTGTPALSKGHQQEKGNLNSKKPATAGSCGKTIKVARNAARDVAVNVAVIKKNWCPSFRGFC